MTDTSFWTTLNPNIIQTPTRKQYFGKYTCRLVINCPAGRLIDSPGDDMWHALRQKILTQRAYNYGGSWWAHKNKELSEANVQQLNIVRDIKRDSPHIKVRVEEPQVQFYATCEDDLKVIAVRFPDNLRFKISIIQLPASDKDVAALKSGKIILPATSKNEYKYKIVFRDGHYPLETKQQILSYLESLGSDAKLSKGSSAMLQREFSYMWGVFAYIMDEKVVTFLNLIAPNSISKIHELEKSS